jgi:hypothetical protein
VDKLGKAEDRREAAMHASDVYALVAFTTGTCGVLGIALLAFGHWFAGGLNLLVAMVLSPGILRERRSLRSSGDFVFRRQLDPWGWFQLAGIAYLIVWGLVTLCNGSPLVMALLESL